MKTQKTSHFTAFFIRKRLALYCFCFFWVQPLLSQITDSVSSHFIDSLVVNMQTSTLSGIDPNISIPQIAPVSPNAASLGVFGEIPVGHYTGVPNISIPIYEIDLDGKKIPISLNYHASGIKVSQDASWVGLGWALNAGGCIIKNTQGWDDFELNPTGYYYYYNLPPRYQGYISETHPDYWKYGYSDLVNNRKDSEPDIFSFNFANISGSCFFPRSGENLGTTNVPKAVVRKSEQYLDINYDLIKNSWTIIDGGGFKYFFGTKEKTKVYTFTDTHNYNSYLDFVNNKQRIPARGLQHEIVSSWQLDSIVSPKNNKISFSYKMDQISTPVSLSESTFQMIDLLYMVGNPDVQTTLASSNYSYSQIQQALLTRIAYNDTYIDFVTSDREDIEPANKNTPKAQKLSQILVKHRNELVKDTRLEHFYSGTKGNYNNCRLYLKEAFDVSDAQSKENKYVFGYISPELLPEKTSTKVDYWGYAKSSSTPIVRCWSTQQQAGYAGKSVTLIPPAQVMVGGDTKIFYGQDRKSDETTIQYGTLNSIKYPTSGQTLFTYEPHEFASFQTGAYKEKSYDVRFDDVYMGGPDNYDTQDFFPEGEMVSETFTLDKSATVKLHLDIEYMVFEFPLEVLYRAYTAHIKVLKNGRFQVLYSWPFPEVPQGSSSRLYADKQYTLPPGTYQVSVTRKFSFYDVTGNEYQALGGAKLTGFSSFPELCNTGAGLRIKEMENLVDGKTSQLKKYTYNNGLLMSEPRHHYNWTIDYSNFDSDGSWGNGYQRFIATYAAGVSSSFIPFSNSASGGSIGYGFVQEENWDESFQGMTEYHYFNEPDEILPEYTDIIPGLPLHPNLDNGLLYCKQIYDKDLTLLQKDDYEYDFVRGIYVTGAKSYSPPYETNKIGLYFYDLKSQWWKLLKQESTMYYGNDVATVITEYDYNSTNYLPSKISTIKSDGKRLEKEVKYITDYSPAGIIEEMRKKHMYSLPIEEKESVNSAVTLTRKNLYKYDKGRVLLGEVALSKGTNITEGRLKYIDYDVYGNPAYIIKDEIEKVVYLWGYKGQYPIAKIENSTYESVKTALGSVTPDELAKSSVPNMMLVNSLRDKLPGAFVSTYEYKPLVGVIKEVDPKGLVMTYIYDSMRRLKRIVDGQGSVVEEFDYSYKR